MKKKIILMSIYLVVVASVLALTTVAFAWYTSNTEVNVTPTTITSMEVEGAGVEDVVDNIAQYKGETGLGGENDKPYIATKILSVEHDVSSVSAGTDVVTCNFKEFSVTLPTGEEVVDDNITSHFTFRIVVVKLDSNNTVTYESEYYYPGADGVVVNADGKALKYSDTNYFTPDSGTGIKKTYRGYIQLQLVFLDEQSYKNYCDTTPGTDDITPFKFSDYQYMGSTFHASFEVGFDTLYSTYDEDRI